MGRRRDGAALRRSLGVAGAVAGLLLSTAVLADAVPRFGSASQDEAADRGSTEAASAAEGTEGASAVGDTAVSPCPDATVPVRLSSATVDQLHAGRGQLVSVVLRLDDLTALAVDEGAVADGAGMVTLDPSVQALYQGEVDVRAATMLLVADLPADRLHEPPVIAPVATLSPASAGIAERPGLQLFATAGLLVRHVDEVCRTASSVDVSAIGSRQSAVEDAGFGVPSTAATGTSVGGSTQRSA